ncbi:uncharacterized protein FIBRA_04431 [Fibroporia radiculosa]|uniref:Uncharacterized protein n=1 Tax=Fibroporia radiculosa TaxID=599839 RepID=J4G7C9_9APHY|nr:uncharacterized protein FIBRA_04431 [Fibroporia radiculosa]CCM02338.1 predicted protein [Fibroporia radiculosa]
MHVAEPVIWGGRHEALEAQYWRIKLGTSLHMYKTSCITMDQKQTTVDEIPIGLPPTDAAHITSTMRCRAMATPQKAQSEASQRTGAATEHSRISIAVADASTCPGATAITVNGNLTRARSLSSCAANFVIPMSAAALVVPYTAILVRAVRCTRARSPLLRSANLPMDPAQRSERSALVACTYPSTSILHCVGIA